MPALMPIEPKLLHDLSTVVPSEAPPNDEGDAGPLYSKNSAYEEDICPESRPRCPPSSSSASVSTRMMAKSITPLASVSTQDGGAMSNMSSWLTPKASCDVPSRDSSVTSIKSKPSKQSQSQDPLRVSHFCIMLCAVVLPNAAAIMTFSAMGKGFKVYNAIAPRNFSLYGDFLLGGSCVLAGFMLVLDWWYWPKICKVITSVFPVTIFYAGAILKGRKYPWAALMLTLFITPVLLGWIRLRCCRLVKRQQFYRTVAVLTFCAAVVIAGFWFEYLVIDGNGWSQSTQDALAAKSKDVYDNVYEKRPLVYGRDCGPDKDESYLNSLDQDVREDIGFGCDEAGTLWFLCWVCPFAAIGSDLVVAAFCMFTGVVGSTDINVKSIQRNLTRFMLMLSFILSGLYACVTVSATSVRFGSTLMAFFFAALGFSVVWILTEVDMESLKATAKSSKIMLQLIDIMQSDWTKALIVSALGFPMSVFFCLNYLCQQCRKCRRRAGTQRKEKFTPLGLQVQRVVIKWKWTSIFIKIILLSELFFVLQVGVAKVTYIFLSWLNSQLEDTPLGIVVILVYLIGGSMFLLPPVPGLPVYVFAGVLLGEKGRQDENVGFWLGCLIAMALGLFTKLCACVGQYMIGYYMGKSVKIQQLIGVDKVPTRAIEHMLKSRGLNPGKVALLVGGPDWPTSVTCGIVKVNIPQMLLGTLPVVVLLAPCTLAGACMGRVSPGQDSDWSMLANSFTATAAVVNMASMAYAVYTISDTVAKHGDDLAKPRPEHEVVQNLTSSEAAYNAVYRRVTCWSNLSLFWRTALLTSAVSAVLSNGIFVIFAELCFRSFAVSSDIHEDFSKDGLEGNAFNIIIDPVGPFALGMFFIGVCLHLLFVEIMRRRSRWNYLNEVSAPACMGSSTTGAPPSPHSPCTLG